LLVYAARGIPDPEAAAILIESLGKISENKTLEIDTQELRKQGATLKTKMEKIIQSFIEQQEGQGQVQGQTPTSVRDGVMYG
jgi:predicted ATP-grasp superfamily ATP-dependent carboligase